MLSLFLATKIFHPVPIHPPKMTKRGEEEDLGEEKMCYEGERDSYVGKAVTETES